jgi:hypothetical protein
MKIWIFLLAKEASGDAFLEAFQEFVKANGLVQKTKGEQLFYIPEDPFRGNTPSNYQVELAYYGPAGDLWAKYGKGEFEYQLGGWDWIKAVMLTEGLDTESFKNLLGQHGLEENVHYGFAESKL